MHKVITEVGEVLEIGIELYSRLSGRSSPPTEVEATPNHVVPVKFQLRTRALTKPDRHPTNFICGLHDQLVEGPLEEVSEFFSRAPRRYSAFKEKHVFAKILPGSTRLVEQTSRGS